MMEHLIVLFPKLQGAAFRVTSAIDPRYNCVAWAAGVADDWWWPHEDPKDGYWPESVARIRTLEAFRAVFSALGYAVCLDESPEPDYEKIALFADVLGIPTHAARQLPTGRWTSKLGRGEDIEHDLRDLEGDLYGNILLIMRRPAASSRPTANEQVASSSTD